MSTQIEGDHSSPPILHFIKPSNSTESPSNKNNEKEGPSAADNNTEQSIENKNEEKPITTVSHSRRVHFPSDDSQLRLITYTPGPLASQPLLSLSVILQRYRSACQRLQVRPLNALIHQLNTMDDGRKSFLDRLDCLKIVNEKIDLKHIDAIEEILSHCRFHTLDFEASSIDDSALTQLFDVIEYYESCTHINLSNNRSIGFLGYQALTKYLKRTSSLERLDMNAMRFDDNNILSFTRSLRLSTTLYELHVESCQLNGKILQKFIQNLRSCTCLRELYLCDNRLQVQDSLLINELIRTCGQFLFLLDLRSNSLQDNGISHLASQLSQYDEHHTHENSLHKISFQANQLTPQGVGFLAKSLLHNRTLRSLNLSQNNITNEGLFLLRDALLTNRSINELILRNCRLTDQAAIALAEFIAESSTIQYIDLRENNIQASGICGMAIAIKSNKSLLHLDFDPIISTPTYQSPLSINNNNNIDRTGNTNSLLSLSNLRRMTTGFSSFTNSTQFPSSIGGGGTRELLEQKARWMNDIAAVCQRNILIYEENLRLQEAEQNNQAGNTNQPITTVIRPEDIELKEQTLESEIKDTNEVNLSSLITTDDDNKVVQAIDDNHEIDQPVNNNDEINLSSQSTLDGDNQIVQEISSNHEIKQSADIPTNNDTSAEQTTVASVDDNHEVKQSPTDSAEFASNDVTQDQSESNTINQNSTFLESPSLSDLPDDVHDDNQRKIRHSDSLYLLRKKVRNGNDDDDTSDEDSQLPSLTEQLETLDGV